MTRATSKKQRQASPESTKPPPVALAPPKPAKAPQTRAPRPQTREELRARVLDRCKRELRNLDSGPRGNPDAFIRGLRSIAHVLEMSCSELKTVQRGYQLLTQIRDARDEAQKLLASQQDAPLARQAPLNALANIVELLRSVPGACPEGRKEFFLYSEENKHVTRRELVLRLFDKPNFVEQHRHATLRELALLSLFMDPGHGIEGRVGERDLGTVWSIFKHEENAIRLARERLRKSDPVYRRQSAE